MTINDLLLTFYSEFEKDQTVLQSLSNQLISAQNASELEQIKNIYIQNIDRICEACTMLGLNGIYNYLKAVSNKIEHICAARLVLPGPSDSDNKSHDAAFSFNLVERDFLLNWSSLLSQYIRSCLSLSDTWPNEGLKAQDILHGDNQYKFFKIDQSIIEKMLSLLYTLKDTLNISSSTPSKELKVSLQNFISATPGLENLLKEIQLEHDSLWDEASLDLSVSYEQLDKPLLKGFLSESEQNLEHIYSFLDSMASIPSEGALACVIEIKRNVHTIKGSAQMCSIAQIATIMHKIEDLLDVCTKSQSNAIAFIKAPQLQDAIRNCLMVVEQCVSHLGYSTALFEDPSSVLKDFMQLAKMFCQSLGQSPTYNTSTALQSHSTHPPHAPGEELTHVENLSPILPSLSDLHYTSASPSSISPVPSISAGSSVATPLTKTLHENLNLHSNAKASHVDPELESIKNFDKLFYLSDSASMRLQRVSTYQETIKKLQKQISALGAQMATNLSSLSAHSSEPNSSPESSISPLNQRTFTPTELALSHLQENHLQLNLLSQELLSTVQKSDLSLSSVVRDEKEIAYLAMQAKMVSLSSLQTRLSRVVSSACKSLSLDISFEFIHNNVFIDRQTAQKILEPVMHILRNAVDHGFSSNSDKTNVGNKNNKQNKKITLTAASYGNNIEIVVKDNGQGINFEKIISVAKNKNIIQEPGAKILLDGLYSTNKEEVLLSKKKITDLIFNHGFSTKDSVTALSGRGVGLDVVLTHLRAIGGMCTASESPNSPGTAFTLKFPATTSRTNAIVFCVNNYFFCLNTIFVSKVLSPSAWQELCESSGSMLSYNQNSVNHIIPMLQASDLLSVPPADTKAKKGFAILLTGTDSTDIALICDSIHGMQEVVLQPQGVYYDQQDYTLGLSVLQNSMIAPLINPITLLQAHFNTQSHPGRSAHTSTLPELPIDEYVLICDDSSSIRLAMQEIFAPSSLRVLSCINGQDALDKLHLEAHPPLAVFTDLEMPQMDGLELISALKTDAVYKNVPCYMVSAKASPWYAALAQRVGAASFISKPFEAKELLSLVPSGNWNKK